MGKKDRYIEVLELSIKNLKKDRDDLFVLVNEALLERNTAQDLLEELEQIVDVVLVYQDRIRTHDPLGQLGGLHHDLTRLRRVRG